MDGGIGLLLVFGSVWVVFTLTALLSSPNNRWDALAIPAILCGVPFCVVFPVLCIEREWFDMDELVNFVVKSADDVLLHMPRHVMGWLVPTVIGAGSAWFGGRVRRAIGRWREPKPVPPLGEVAQAVIAALREDSDWEWVNDNTRNAIKSPSRRLYVFTSDGDTRYQDISESNRLALEKREEAAIKDAAVAVGQRLEAATAALLVERDRQRKEALVNALKPVAQVPAAVTVPVTGAASGPASVTVGGLGRAAFVAACPNCKVARAFEADGTCCHCRQKTVDVPAVARK